jgi:hypothetical protein
MRTPLIGALLCGALPLVSGSAIFILWCGTGWDWLPLAGILTIYAGVIAVLVGMVFLLAHVVKAIEQRRLWRAANLAAILAVLGLLGLNFPACAAIIGAVDRMERVEFKAARVEELFRQGSVRVVNASGRHVEAVRIAGLDRPTDLGSIPVDGEVSMFFDVAAGTVLTVEAKAGGNNQSASFAVAQPGQRGREVAVVVKPDSTLMVAPLSTRMESRDLMGAD